MNAAARAPDIEVIVLCQNEERTLRSTLEAILAQELRGRFSVTVIDCESRDGSIAIARSLPVRLIEVAASEFHHAGTRNLGAKATNAAIIVYTNGHAMPVGTGWLLALTAPFSQDPRGDLAAVYGRQLPCNDANPMERFMVSWFFGDAPRVQRAQPGRSVWREQTLFSTVNCALRHDLWAKRPFSDAVAVAEDQEWSRYWLEQGYGIVYEPAAAVIHSHNESLARAFRRAYDAGYYSERSYLPRDRGAVIRFTKANLLRLGDEAVFLVRNGYVRWLPYAALYEGLRVMGWMLGRQQIGRPMWLRRRSERHAG